MLGCIAQVQKQIPTFMGVSPLTESGSKTSEIAYNAQHPMQSRSFLRSSGRPLAESEVSAIFFGAFVVQSSSRREVLSTSNDKDA